MERCPVCNAKFKEDPVCYRCGTDLSALLRIERQAELLERQAMAFYGAGYLDEAQRVAEQALALMRSPLRCRLVEFLAWEIQRKRWGLRRYALPILHS
ncbi:MAG: hypothetical protein U1F76_17425 [Candidatus Competibacteraceae bacterium]